MYPRILVFLSMVFLGFNFSSSLASLPEVRFQAYSNGCKAWFKPNGMVTATRPSGPGDSGVQLNSIDWTHCATQGLDPNQHPYLRVQGSNSFQNYGAKQPGIGEAVLTLHVQSLENGPWGSYPHVDIFPSGGARIWVGLNLGSVSEEEKEFTFFVDRKPQLLTSGAWIPVDTSSRVSASAKQQIESGQPSLLHGSGYYDFTDVHPGVSFQTGHQTFQIPYRIISPKHCSLEERLDDPVLKFSTLSAEEILHSLVCETLIPGFETQDKILWSERATQIRPRIKSLEELKANPSLLDRFRSSEFTKLIDQVIERKLKNYYRWAIQTYGPENESVENR